MADLMSAVQQGRVSPKGAERIWTYFVSRQVMLGEVLQTLGRIDAAAFSAILLQHSSTDLPLGDFLVRQEIITKETLDHAIARHFIATLREAREHIAALREEVEKLTMPPSAYGTFLAANDDGTWFLDMWNLMPEKGEICAAVQRNVWPWIAAGIVTSVIDAVMPITEAAEAHRLIADGSVTGKLALQVR